MTPPEAGPHTKFTARKADQISHKGSPGPPNFILPGSEK